MRIGAEITTEQYRDLATGQRTVDYATMQHFCLCAQYNMQCMIAVVIVDGRADHDGKRTEQVAERGIEQNVKAGMTPV